HKKTPNVPPMLFTYPPPLVPPRRCRWSNSNLICTPEGIPCYCCDSRQAENALDPIALLSLSGARHGLQGLDDLEQRRFGICVFEMLHRCGKQIIGDLKAQRAIAFHL